MRKSTAFMDGVRDKLANILEPRPQLDPESQAFRDYVKGYLETPWPKVKGELV